MWYLLYYLLNIFWFSFLVFSKLNNTNTHWFITLGASSDLKQATSIATHMVKDWGMSEKIGLRTMAESAKAFQGEALGPSTSEMVR